MHRPIKSPSEDSLAARFVPGVVLLLTAAVFFPVVYGGFVNWDDDFNLLRNPMIAGDGPPSLRWILTNTHSGHYIPLTWISLFLDRAIWGMNPFGYHFTNLTLHAVNAALFSAVMLRLLSRNKNAAAPIAAVAAALFFSIHPLRVESVAWVTERRDVLSGAFLFASVLSYLTSVQRGARPRLAASLSLFAAACLSKSIVMLAPAALLALDFFPLRRLSRRAVLEKVPFFAVSLATAIMALTALNIHGSGEPSWDGGVLLNIAIACHAAVFYILKTAVPTGLSPLYEFPEDMASWVLQAAVMGALLLAALMISFARRRRCPALVPAWAVYFAFLAPVSGLMQRGPQIAANRFTYLSCLGWAALLGAGFLRIFRERKPIVKAAAAAVGLLYFLFLAGRARQEIAVWRNSETLWRAVLSRHPDSFVANYNLGSVLLLAGRPHEAVEPLERAARRRPDVADTYINLGNANLALGRFDDARRHLEKATQLSPHYPEPYYNMGNLYSRQGRWQEAARHYRIALEKRPSYVAALKKLDDLNARRRSKPKKQP